MLGDGEGDRGALMTLVVGFGKLLKYIAKKVWEYSENF